MKKFMNTAETLLAESLRGFAMAHADIANAQGTKIGTAKITATGKGVKIAVTVSQLTPGEHGIHIHTVGKCEAPAFISAGGHFNPTSAHHGTHNTQDPHPHLGDLKRIRCRRLT